MRPFAAAFLLLFSSSCLRINTYFDGYSPEHDYQIKEEIHHRRVDFYGFGYWPEKQELRASELCPADEKLSRLLVETGFVDGLLGLITLNIYTPRSVYVACAPRKKVKS